MAWNPLTATSRIEASYEAVASPEVRDYVRTMDLTRIPTAAAYRMNAVHFYIDIRNMAAVIGDGSETEQRHKRMLRFIDLQHRAIRRILAKEEVMLVDFHGQRLHAVVAMPYDDEAARVNKAVAVAQLVRDVLAKTADADDAIEAADVRVGIDTGIALVVNNGARGLREPLFLGAPANHAAKHASRKDRAGIFLTNEARAVLGLARVASSETTPLTDTAIATCQDEAQLVSTVDGVLEHWRQDLSTHRQKDYAFHRPTPPLSDYDIDGATPKNAGRIEAVSLYADIDGFTAYVGNRMGDDERSKDVVRALHVLRTEMTRVLTDFGGLHVRYIGDCLHGILAVGPASTDATATVSQAVLCAAAIRESFDKALAVLSSHGVETGNLGVAIGVEYGPIAMAQLGLRGERVAVCMSKAVLECEECQKAAEVDGEPAIALGVTALAQANLAVRDLFGEDGIADVSYSTVVDELTASGDFAAKALAAAVMSPAEVKAMGAPLKAHCR